MKKFGLCSLSLSLVLMSGCSQPYDGFRTEAMADETVDIGVYEFLIQGNEKHGATKDDICRSTFKCTPDQISKNVIVAPTWKAELFKPYVNDISYISGPTGHGYTLNQLTIGGEKVTHITTGVGSGNMLDVVLALGCTPCENIVFVGSVGALKEEMNIGDIVIPERSICCVGANRYLCSKNMKDNDCWGNIYFPNNELFVLTKSATDKILKNTDIRMYDGVVCSVDTIFAQYAHLAELIDLGCNSIEMETATLFEAANLTNIKAVALLSVSDNTISKRSLYNGRTDEDIVRKDRSKNEIIPRIALEVLGFHEE